MRRQIDGGSRLVLETGNTLFGNDIKPAGVVSVCSAGDV